MIKIIYFEFLNIIYSVNKDICIDMTTNHMREIRKFDCNVVIFDRSCFFYLEKLILL